MVARKLRCAKIIAPANVLYTSNEVNTDRARTSKKLENQGVSASKIEAGSGRTTQNRARAAQLERKNGQFERTSASEAPPGSPKIEKRARARQLRARKRVRSPRGAGGPAKPPNENFGIFEWTSSRSTAHAAVMLTTTSASKKQINYELNAKRSTVLS